MPTSSSSDSSEEAPHPSLSSVVHPISKCAHITVSDFNKASEEGRRIAMKEVQDELQHLRTQCEATSAFVTPGLCAVRHDLHDLIKGMEDSTAFIIDDQHPCAVALVSHNFGANRMWHTGSDDPNASVDSFACTVVLPLNIEEGSAMAVELADSAHGPGETYWAAVPGLLARYNEDEPAKELVSGHESLVKCLEPNENSSLSPGEHSQHRESAEGGTAWDAYVRTVFRPTCPDSQFASIKDYSSTGQTRKMWRLWVFGTKNLGTEKHPLELGMWWKDTTQPAGPLVPVKSPGVGWLPKDAESVETKGGVD